LQLADFDERLTYIGSSIKASWRAKQLKAVCDRFEAGEEDAEDVVGVIADLAAATDNLCEAIHEFAAEADTKAVEVALREFAHAASLRLREFFTSWVPDDGDRQLLGVTHQ